MNSLVEDKAISIAEALQPIVKALPEYFIVAGGAFRVGAPINDYDIYPYNDGTLPKKYELELIGIEHEILASTSNSLTVRFADVKKTVQFCNYRKPDLATLVDSFDFNDIQAGAVMRQVTPDDAHPYRLLKVDAYEYTEEYERYAVHGQVRYMGTEFPLSTLIRLGKYNVSRSARVILTLEILADVCARGFDGYEDFKNQLDAVDLMIKPDHLGGVADSNLGKIYTRLNDRPTEHWTFVVDMEEAEARDDGVPF